MTDTKQTIINELKAYVDGMAKYGCYLIFNNNFEKAFTCSSKVYDTNLDSPNGYKFDSYQKSQRDRECVLIQAGG